MANKRTRDRQLAKQAARRRAERESRRRKRNAALWGGAALGLVAIVVGFFVITGGEEQPRAINTPEATPTEVVPIAGPKKIACGAKAPAAADQPKPQFPSYPPMTIDKKANYVATMRTSCGTIRLGLFARDAPLAVNSFVFLANQGYLDGIRFHRIAPGFVIQGGDPLGDGSGGPGYQFDNEIVKSLRFDREGLLAMANSGPDTNGSQFFITLAETPELDPTDQASYTIFGEVISGMNVVDRIAEVPVEAEVEGGEKSSPLQSVYIEKVTISDRA